MKEHQSLLEMRDITKRFPGVLALSSVDFSLRRGEVHSLMGENGAGKSTLVKVLTGVHRRDGGTVVVDGREISPRSTHEAQNMGISTVYQEVNLLPNLSVAENIFIGREPRKAGRIDWGTMRERSRELLEDLNIQIDVTRNLEDFPLAVQQMTAIARALDQKSQILILDEPTSSLDIEEVEQLFRVIRRLKEKGIAIIFISHFLDQVYQISDRITVLRNGAFIGEYETEKIPKLELVSRMLGKELESFDASRDDAGEERAVQGGEPLLEVRNLARKKVVGPLSFDIRKGEVLGMAGLLGSGRTETAKLLFGVMGAQGMLKFNGEEVAFQSPAEAIRRGVAFCPEDRKQEGLIPDLTVRENIVLALQGQRSLFNTLPLSRQTEIADRFIKLLGIKTPSAEQIVSTLSGGNQQKVVIARWLASQPKLFIVDEPTRGIDVGAKAEILKLILQLAREGMSILFISSEIEEVIRVSDRILVMKDRRIIDVVDKRGITEQDIMAIIAKESA